MKIIGNSKNTHLNYLKKYANDSDEIIVFSPFCYQDFDDLFEEILTKKLKKFTLVTTLKPEDAIYKANSLVSFVDSMNSRQIIYTISIDNRLHGKLYFFLNKGEILEAIVTSANFTENGMRINHEWGCIIDNVDDANKLLIEAKQGIEVKSVSEEQIIRLMLEVEEYQKTHTIQTKPDPVKISRIIDSITGISWEEETRLFLKPIGSAEDQIFNGDYSAEDEMYFSRRRPNSVRVNDLLICYAVGATKLISVYKVLSEPMNINDKNTRWPWYVEAVNLTPEYGKVWFNYENTLAKVTNHFLSENKQNYLTYNEGKTLGALNFGADKIRLSDDFGKFLIKIIEGKITL